MKTNSTIFVLIIATVIINSVTSCTNSSVKEKKEELAVNKEKELIAPANPIDPSDQIPHDQAKLLTDDFRDKNITNISIPLAWEFKSAHMLALSQIAPTGGVRFYAALKPTSATSCNATYKELTIIAVPTDANGNDILSNTSGVLTYDFADPCPTKCSTPNNILMPTYPAGTPINCYNFTRKP